jgi:hypothetical protein
VDADYIFSPHPQRRWLSSPDSSKSATALAYAGWPSTSITSSGRSNRQHRLTLFVAAGADAHHLDAKVRDDHLRLLAQSLNWAGFLQAEPLRF